MDPEVLVIAKEQLTKEMIDAGERLVAKLDEIGFPVTAAFWLFDREINEWRFTLATPETDTAGSLAVYGTVHRVMDGIWGKDIDEHLLVIRAISPNSELATRLKKVPGVSHQIGRTKFA